jgi:hypothetical protein
MLAPSDLEGPEHTEKNLFRIDLALVRQEKCMNKQFGSCKTLKHLPIESPRKPPCRKMPPGIPSCRDVKIWVSLATLVLALGAVTASFRFNWKRVFVLFDAAPGPGLTASSVKR